MDFLEEVPGRMMGVLKEKSRNDIRKKSRRELHKNTSSVVSPRGFSRNHAKVSEKNPSDFFEGPKKYSLTLVSSKFCFLFQCTTKVLSWTCCTTMREEQ